MSAPLHVGTGITFGAGITLGTVTPLGGLTIATNYDGNLVGWNPNALSVAVNPAIGTTYTVGSTITWQDNTTAIITQIDDYSPIYIDIFWDTPKTGTLFPITLSN